MEAEIPAALSAAFRQGLEQANNPDLSEDHSDGLHTTNLASFWLYDRCPAPGCGHSFRTDDLVLVEGDRVRHAGGDLDCRGEHAQVIGDIQQESAFCQGLYEAWPLPKNLRAHRLEPGHFLLVDPAKYLQRIGCAVCGHSLRTGETVVMCPCRPDAPMCRLAIHLDPLRGLNCWHEWSAGMVQEHCPVTSKPLAQIRRGGR